ncbi:MAG: cytidylate kinase [Gammaproteobacteria bacterium RIFOXYA12_FULL_61_12]|nr:MAG: cytidylate kinase [Gammaproteobacteria bacterium RIFOXYD12_FULL_61_37]OGT89717.1 MAG: cytidylate kinase [Gammaproteobacteria bacterium RIFOXYA12_FULL_61_12]
MNSPAPIITIDGPSGSGKGTIAKRLADRLGWHFLDSGALYRVVGLLAEQRGITPDSPGMLGDLARTMPLRFDGEGRVLLDGEDVSDAIRTEKAGNAASKVAAVPQVREALVIWQRSYVKPPGLVADGRDMGSVIFPGAEVKIFLTASAEERAARRYKQLKEKGLDVRLASLTAEIRERDERDRNRSVAPLVAPAAALEVESTNMSIDEVFDRVLDRVKDALPNLTWN